MNLAENAEKNAKLKFETKAFKSTEDALKALANHEIDCMLVSNYRINRVNDLCAENNLATLSTGETIEMGFAVRREDDCLYSILNKVTRYVPAATINSALTDYGFRDERTSLVEVLMDNLPTVVAVGAVIVVVILALVIRSMRAEAKVAEGNQIISEAERDPL